MKIVSRIYNMRTNWTEYKDDFLQSEDYKEFVNRVTEEIQNFMTESGLSLINISFLDKKAVAIFKE